jgi:hypothetical protein
MENTEHISKQINTTESEPLPSARLFVECFLWGTGKISFGVVPDKKHSAKSCSR